MACMTQGLAHAQTELKQSPETYIIYVMQSKPGIYAPKTLRSRNLHLDGAGHADLLALFIK